MSGVVSGCRNKFRMGEIGHILVDNLAVTSGLTKQEEPALTPVGCNSPGNIPPVN